MKDVETVRIELQYSCAGAALLAAMGSGTAALLFLVPVGAALRTALAAFIAALALEAFDRIVRQRGRAAVRSLRVQRDGRIEVETASGEAVAGALRPGSFVAPWLVIVRWRPENRRRDRTVLLLPDMVAAGDFRRLRVLLRWA
ncbi:MAG: protein YgfX [Betaproteobacteria bacterium]